MATLREFEVIDLERTDRWIQYVEWDRRAQCRRIQRTKVLETYTKNGEERVLAFHKGHGRQMAFMLDPQNGRFWVAVDDVNIMTHG
jgi:hypothetical protein